MPPTRDDPPDPTTLLRRFSAHHELDWGSTPYDAADIAHRHGAKAAQKALRLLAQAAAVEPDRTAEFLASLPPNGSAYQLNRRVKSPESLARKIQSWTAKGNDRPMDDILRYTVVVEAPDQVVAAARHTVAQLLSRGWRVRHVMHSYTEGSRYKGVHGYMEAPDSPRIELQFHSTASLKVKELTTPWYEIERSVSATPDERAAARDKCVAASATLSPPAGIAELTTLGGRRVAVNNYSDSQQALTNSANAKDDHVDRPTARAAALEKNDGVVR
ncbi:hypothetical protein ACIA49_17455 [Kribbella sp. NPDC051587]|uniref:hypothetical protein n=1 Tax=Kribbella sp. NPDC051587 TaxID=3364119 RepID=UPI0037B4C23D